MLDIVSAAGEIAREAGKLLIEKEEKRDYGISEKGTSYDFVTEADTASQNLIKERVRALFPGDRVIGEEDNLSDAQVVRELKNVPENQRIWLVDPLDGTLNFIKGLGGYAVSIAVIQGGATVAGAVYMPQGEELYLAEQGAGASRNGQRIRTAHHRELKDALAATGIPVSPIHLRARTGLWNNAVGLEALNLRMLGSAARSQCKVASGGLDVYFEYGPHPWDLAAGMLMVTEAGGKVSRLDGGPFDWGFGGVIESSEEIHQAVVELLKRADPAISDF